MERLECHKEINMSGSVGSVISKRQMMSLCQGWRNGFGARGEPAWRGPTFWALRGPSKRWKGPFKRSEGPFNHSEGPFKCHRALLSAQRALLARIGPFQAPKGPSQALRWALWALRGPFPVLKGPHCTLSLPLRNGKRKAKSVKRARFMNGWFPPPPSPPSFFHFWGPGVNLPPFPPWFLQPCPVPISAHSCGIEKSSIR